jgi:hypothetical protein
MCVVVGRMRVALAGALFIEPDVLMLGKDIVVNVIAVEPICDN